MTIGARASAEGVNARARRMSHDIVAPYIGSVNAGQKQLMKFRARRNSDRATPQQGSKELADRFAGVTGRHNRVDVVPLGDRSSRKLDLSSSLPRLAEMVRSARKVRTA